MGKPSIHQAIAELVEPVVSEEKIELVDVEYQKVGKTWTLRVYIDKAQGVTVDDCQRMSRQIEDLIEVHEVISNPYVLEVSSPGLDRPLKNEQDFVRNKGKRIQVKTFSPINDKKQRMGTVKDFKEGILFLEDVDGILEIPLASIAQAKPVIEF
ncbi:ribosome maturation factor RimP [Candidatus Nitromaritima sp. SCGC AAA799-C22]|nr:ribosome maturation factor RimP [Candidatus Nitromaritima sp. SCGC AAA799-C22]